MHDSMLPFPTATSLHTMHCFFISGYPFPRRFLFTEFYEFCLPSHGGLKGKSHRRKLAVRPLQDPGQKSLLTINLFTPHLKNQPEQLSIREISQKRKEKSEGSVKLMILIVYFCGAHITYMIRPRIGGQGVCYE